MLRGPPGECELTRTAGSKTVDLLAIPFRYDPKTYSSHSCRAIQLSYGTVGSKYQNKVKERKPEIPATGPAASPGSSFRARYGDGTAGSSPDRSGPKGCGSSP